MLFYRTFGDPRAPLLIFLHGFLGSHEDFLPLIEELKDTFFCVAFDLPAHGKSAYAQSSLSKITKTISSFKKPLVLIGYSLGGRIALQLSFLANSVLTFSAHRGLTSLQEKENRLQSDLLWKERLNTLSKENFLTLWYKQPVFASLQKKPELLKSLLKKRIYSNPQELGLLLEELSLGKQPLLTPSCPTGFVYGEEDLFYQKLYEKDPQAFKIPFAGHTVLLENPKACNQVIKIWADALK